MSRTVKIFVIFFLVALLAAALIACNKDTVEYTLSLAYPDIPLVYLEGEADISDIAIVVKDSEGNIIERRNADISMLSAEDREKLYRSGIVAIDINYQGTRLNVTIRINPSSESAYYELTFDAGEGVFPRTTSGAGGGHTYVVSTAQLAAEGKTKLNQLPPEPRRPGYEFKGWYKTQNYSDSPVGAPYYIGYTHTLYAKWVDAKKVEVIFATDYIPELERRVVEYNSDITAPQAPSRDTEIFIGWKYKDEYYLPGTVIPGVTESGYIRGEYRSKEVKITFRSEAWTEDSVFTIPYNTTFTDEPAVPQIEGKTARWMVQVSPTRKEVPVYTNLINDLLVIAEYTPIKYKVNFYYFPDDPWEMELTKAELHLSREQEYNTRVYPIPGFTGDLAVPGGIGEWVYLPSSGVFTSAQSILENGITQNYNIYARYTPVYFKVTFNISGQNYYKEYRYGTRLTPEMFPSELPLPDPKEYTLRWWTRSSDFNNDDYAASFPLAPLTESRTLYANITLNPRIVDFRIFPEDNEGNPVQGVNLNLGRKLLSLGSDLANHTPLFNNAKYEFTGSWTYYDGTAITDFNNIQTFKEYNEDPALNKAIYIRLKVREYKVRFYNAGLEPGDSEAPYKIVFTEVSSADYKYGTKILNNPAGDMQAAPYGGALTVPAYPGSADGDFRFDGWYTTPNYNLAKINFDNGYTISQATAFYAKWIDTEIGTEGLKFKGIYETDDYGNEIGDVLGYTVSGFEPVYEHYDEIYIPRFHEGLPVSGISESAFFDALGTTVVTIKITNNIANIAEGAFMSLTGFEGFTFADDQEENPSHFYKLHNGVLYSLADGTLVVYPSGKTGDSFEIPASIPTGDGEITVTRIAEGAFATNNYIKSITFAAGSQVTEIGAYAFLSCQNLISVDIPDSLVAIRAQAFDSSIRLATLNFTENSSLIYVETGAFRDTEWLEGNSGMAVLAGVLVRYSGTDTELTIDDSIKALADDAFYDATATLKVRRINFTANSRLRYIGSKAFEPCTLLASIYLLADYNVEFAFDSFEGIKGVTLYVPEARRDYYRSVLGDFTEEQILPA